MEYKYACIHRPAGPGAIPASGLISVSDADKTKTGYWSLAIYNRELTVEEVSDFELARIDYTETEEFPAISADRDVMFNGTKEEKRAYRKACTEALIHWARIVRNPRFCALKFNDGRDRFTNTYILHPSTRAGIDWQLTSIAPDGFANCHTEYTVSNEREEFNLFHDLFEKVEWTGTTVTVMYR